MPIFSRDCPHCGTRNVSFDVKNSFHNPLKTDLWSVMMICGSCFMPACAVLRTGSQHNDPMKAAGDISRQFGVMSSFPVKRVAACPEHVPDSAARSFVEGLENLHDGRFTSAAAMLRRSLDIALKQFSDEVQAWKLEKRIDQLADKGLITRDLQKWAHKIRDEGNSALHEDTEPSKESTEELKLFTELVLIYLFTLPFKVNQNIAAE